MGREEGLDRFLFSINGQHGLAAQINAIFIPGRASVTKRYIYLGHTIEQFVDPRLMTL
jgi:hypothetical protein